MAAQRALVIGCGRIAGGYNRGPEDALVLTHALAYTRHPAYALAACVDPDPQARADFAARWQVPAAFPSLDAALEAGHYDVASICSPTGTQLGVLERLLSSSIERVFAEKPLDGDAPRARAVAARYAAANRPIAVNFTRRWDKTMADLRDEISGGALGALRSIVGWYGRGVVNNGSHLIDLVHFLTDRRLRPVDVVAARDDGVAGDPTVDAVLYAGEVPVHLVGCDGRDYARFELTLSFANCIVEILEGGLFVRRRSIAGSEVFPEILVARDAPRSSTGYGTAMIRALDELTAWHPGDRLSSDPESAIVAIELSVELQNRANSKVWT